MILCVSPVHHITTCYFYLKGKTSILNYLRDAKVNIMLYQSTSKFQSNNLILPFVSLHIRSNARGMPTPIYLKTMSIKSTKFVFLKTVLF